MPAIELDDGELLTENVAILSYIADRYPALMAPGPLGRYRLLEMLSYLATEVHKAFHPLFDPGASAAEKKAAGEAAREARVRRDAAAGPVSLRRERHRRRRLPVRDAAVGGKNKIAIPEPHEGFQPAHEVAADGAGGAAARGARCLRPGRPKPPREPSALTRSKLHGKPERADRRNPGFPGQPRR